MPVLTLNRSEFVSVVSSIRGVTFVSFKARTEPDMRKTGNPFIGKILKVSTVHAIIGNWSYENSLINQAKRESVDTEFEIKPRKWGQRINGAGIVEHNGQFYLEAKIESASSYFIFRNGRKLSEIQLSELSKFIPERSESSTQDAIEKKIILRDYKVSNIVSARFNGMTYRIRPNV